VTDITEQRALADDLRRTTSLFHALVTHLPAGVFFVHGRTGRPILVNARARQLLGQREDASAGLEHLARVYRLHRPDGSPYPAEELPVFQAVRQGGTTMRDDIVVHRPDGRRVPLVTWAAPIQLGRQGGFDAAVWVLEDLTALHQAEAARRDTEGRLRAVVEAMGEALVVQDRRGAVVDLNPAACALFGAPAETLRGHALAELGWSLLREDGTPLPAEEHPAQAVLRTARPVRHLVVGLASGDGPGPVRWLLANALPLGPAGAPAGVVTTFADVTAYRHAQEVLRQSEEKYRGLVESLPLMLIQSDRDLRLLYANPATKAITGYDLDEIASPQAWAALVHPDDLPAFREQVAQALAGEAGRCEIRYRAKDKSEKVAFVICQPRRQGDEVAGLSALVVDVTRERALEQELQRAQRLELVGRLSSGIAHDFNNLLSVVLSLTELARGSLPADHPVHDDLRRIAEAGEQAATLAGQLLAFSRQRRLPPRPLGLNRVVRRALDLLRPTLPLTVTVEPDLAPGELEVCGDETQVQQVLMNLCLNARDAMPQGGRLRVSTAAVEPGAASSAPDGRRRWARLSVEDDGHGMSGQVLARIFDPFFSTKERGTGLGLAVVQQIVESNGGRVEAVSQPGRGACFHVWLPLARAAVGAPECV
jgi:PAS domain S-box-containing protein